jgi:DNA-binding NarL/FixJ family response regulator
METQKLNLFIVDDNKLLATDLKLFLENRFGTDLNITSFYDGESCLKMIDEHTSIVILDYNLNGKNGLETLKAIKEINPKTEVIMLSGNEDIAVAIQTFRAGAKDYVIKGDSDWKKITKIVNQILLAPINILVREFKVTKFVAIFFLTFVIMAVVVIVACHNMK